MHNRSASLLLILSAIIGVVSFAATRTAYTQQTQQRLVESVDITGNRRLRKEDLLYYVQTKAGDTYNEAQVQRDLQALLALGFFDKTSTRVSIEEGTRGGVNVIFEVKELPIIRDIQFEGLKSVSESDVLKAFRERRIGVSKENIYDPVKVRNAIRVIKELLAAKGHPNATVQAPTEEVSQTSIAINFVVNEGERVRVVEIEFTGNKVFKSGTLRSQMQLVKEAGLISRFKGQDILDREKLDYDLRKVQNYMRSKGYLQARFGEPTIEGIGRRTTGFFIPLPFLSSTDEALRVTVPVTEGRLYRVGEIKIEGNSIFSEQQIKSVIGLKPGDVANGEAVGKALFENLKKYYGAQGFIQYAPDLTPTFRDNPQKPDEGIADFQITIDEGKQFTLRRLEFLGNTFTRDNVLRREVLINEGDIYNQVALETSVLRLNQLGYFEPVDKDKDVDFRQNEEEAQVDVNIKVQEKGRQQISFNGGLSGIGGSFFGLDYTTNNLLGRGEILSLNVAFGNRQRSIQFSFTEPYIRNRPITAGFSIFTYSQKFFGEGTLLSNNVNALQGITGSNLDFFNTSEENLFTRTSNGASIFASAPLSEFYRKRRFTQFSRIGLSYQISQSSVKQPTVNAENNPNTFIPIIYDQPNIITSRITPTFSYDTRSYSKDSIDPTGGKEISLALAFTGLGGDVRTYEPTLSYTQFIKVRKKKSDAPEVFGFRILAGHVGSFAISNKVRNSGSLAFVDGVPIYERFFLGDEFTIRGYNVRSISPIVPLDSFVTTQGVVLATNATGTPIPANISSTFSNLGNFTGTGGANSLRFSRTFAFIGGDTQLLGNFEYRVPIFGPLSAAAFADIGTAFNLRTKGIQTFSSNFLTEDQFAATTGASLEALVKLQNPLIALQTVIQEGAIRNALIARDNRLVTSEEFSNALRVGPVDPISGFPVGFQPVFFRGMAQTNTVARLNESLFAKISDYRASLGAEIRIQVPVVNVPFRLIYAFNPNARTGFVNGLPFFFNEKKSVFRFSVGRTF